MNTERLLQLAEHLEKGELAHKIFDYSVYNSNDDSPIEEVNVCGTNGCAIGELPAVWPDDFWWFEGSVYPKGRNVYRTRVGAQEWFDINKEQYTFLFIPNDVLGGDNLNCLDKKATRYQVAEHIRKFVQNGGIYV